MFSRDNFLGLSNQIQQRQVFAPDPHPLIKKAFEYTLSRLELDSTRTQTASTHYQTMQGHLESVLSGVRIRQIGSFQKRTKIRPINNSLWLYSEEDWAKKFSPLDIDTIAILGNGNIVPYGGEGTTPQQALESLYQAVKVNGRYKVKDISISSPVIKLEYSNEFSLEIVPAYVNKTSDFAANRNPVSYLVPNENNLNWKTADYIYDAEFISQANLLLGGKLVPCIKLMKGFIRNQGIPMSSFHVEVFCTLTLNEISNTISENPGFWSYPRLFIYLLKALPKFVSVSIELPGSVSGTQQFEQSLIQSIYGLCEVNSKLAEILDFAGDQSNTIEEWRKFYGYPFPTRETVS